MSENDPSAAPELNSRVFELLIYDEDSVGRAQAIVENIKADYSQPGRYYHTFEHIVNVTDFILAHVEECDNPRVMMWAALYHDDVYYTSLPAGQNEEQSAIRAGADLTGILPDSEITRVQSFIRATANHQVDEHDHDLALFMDADMAILGSPPSIYSEYAANTRREYERVYTPDQYDAGRKSVLRNFQNQPRLFMTETAHTLFEEQARENILRELASLVSIQQSDGQIA
jgi:predicted metal-dependent HD superfamily phosphohydrolase